MFMGSMNAPRLKRDIVNRIYEVTDKYKGNFVNKEYHSLRYLAMLIELSDHLAQQPLPVKQEPGLTYGSAFTQETCCDQSLYED